MQRLQKLRNLQIMSHKINISMEPFNFLDKVNIIFR